MASIPSWSISTGNGRLTGSKSTSPRASGRVDSIAATRSAPSAIVPGMLYTCASAPRLRLAATSRRAASSAYWNSVGPPKLTV